jgi:hypothetical protein
MMARKEKDSSTLLIGFQKGRRLTEHSIHILAGHDGMHGAFQRASWQ